MVFHLPLLILICSDQRILFLLSTDYIFPGRSEMSENPQPL